MNICRDCKYHHLEDYTRHICKHPDVQRIDYISGNAITILCQSIRRPEIPECHLFRRKHSEGTTK